jgi:hypothetical protein
MPDFYKTMFTLDAGKTHTVLGSGFTGSGWTGATLQPCTGLISDVTTRVNLKFAGPDPWQTGVTLNAGVLYPYKLIGVYATVPVHGLN